MGRARKTVVIGLLGVVTGLVVVPVGAWLARDLIATSIARDTLLERGLLCDERLAVSLSATFDEATLAPTRCGVADSVVEWIELGSPMRVHLDGAVPTSVEVGLLQVGLSEARVGGASGWAAPLRRLRLEERVAGVVKGLSELSRLSLPPMRAARFEVLQGGHPIATGAQVQVDPAASGLTVGLGELTFPASVGTLTLTAVRGHASPADVELSGQAQAHANVLFFQVARGGAFWMGAHGLDTDRPRFELRGDF